MRRSLVTPMVELRIATPEVVEVLLNHVSGHRGGVAGVYNREPLLEGRRAALERRSDHLVTLANKPDRGL